MRHINNLRGARSLPGFRAGTQTRLTCQGGSWWMCFCLRRVVWQTLFCYPVTLLGFCCTSVSAFRNRQKMLRSQAFFKTPRGGRGVHLFIKPSTVFLSEKVNNCYASRGSGKEFIKWSRKKEREHVKRGGEDVTEGHTEWVTKPYWIYLSCSASQMNLIYCGWQQWKCTSKRSPAQTNVFFFLMNEEQVLLRKHWSQTDTWPIQSIHKNRPINHIKMRFAD